MGTKRKMIRLTSQARAHWMHRLRHKLQPETKPEAIGYILLHGARTGSTALTSQLKQHPDLVAQGELMMEHRHLHLNPSLPPIRRTIKWLCPHKGYLESMINTSRHRWRKASQRAGRQLKAYGFAFLRVDGYTLDLDHAQALEKFKRHGIDHFIFLERSNVVRKYVSTRLARKNYLWHVRTHETMPTNYKATLRVDIQDGGQIAYRTYDSLLARLDSELAYNQRMRGLIEEAERLERSDERWLHLTYEDDIENDPGVGYAKVCEFLGVEAVPAVCKTRHLNAAPLSEIIENYDECREYLRGTPYEKMLEE